VAALWRAFSRVQCLFLGREGPIVRIQTPITEHVNNPSYRAHKGAINRCHTGTGSRLREFPVYFPRNSPVYRYAFCGILSAMKFRLRDFDRSLASGFAADEKLSDFPSSAIQSSKSSVICRVSRVPHIGLTVKFRNRASRKILPSDLPSKPFAWGQ
jgi:hypothetical protein